VYVADDVRDFNFTAARDYHRRTGTSFDGQTRINVFTRSLSGSTILTWAKRALAQYEARMKRQYPYPTLTFGESSGGIGMESPGHIWLPYGYGNSRLPFLISHEVAHQWFYAAVGNDQTTDPFADEALAEFLNRQWMGYRGSDCARSRLDRSMYAYSAGCYYEIIYVQGTNFLRDLKDDMGSNRFWAALRDYYDTYKWKMGSNKKLLEKLRDHAGDRVLPRYRARFPSLY
jgi:aminopeptidase N